MVSNALMMEVIERKPLIDSFSEEGERPRERPAGEIELKDVVFAYPSRPNIQVCNGYSLRVEAGQSCALCGPSGAGKSTVVSLLLRFYDPQGGAITLDGKDIKSLNISWLRAQMGYVGQEPVLFSGTIMDNIAYGLDEGAVKHMTDAALMGKSRRELVTAAAIMSNAHNFIMGFPEGYDTNVGASGSALSGGQKQRIAIARALVKRPAVLLLDEATSALDATSERLVQESIDKLQSSKTQTTIIIAHRLSTIRNADKIAVVNGGRIVEEGTHEQLLALNGAYADLVRVQMDGHDEAAEAEATASANLPEKVKAVAEGPSVSTEVVKVTPQEEQLFTADDQKRVSSRLWIMVMDEKAWYIPGVIAGGAFGACFPTWGYLMGRMLGNFFHTSPHHLRKIAEDFAWAFGAIALVAFFSNIIQNWFIGRVGSFYTRAVCIFRS